MAERNLQQHLETNQVALWNFEVLRWQQEEVFCPMCEITHANNTNCQRND